MVRRFKNSEKERNYRMPAVIPLYPAPMTTTLIGRYSSIEKSGSVYMFDMFDSGMLGRGRLPSVLW